MTFCRVQGSHSPHLTVQEAQDMGFKIIVYAAAVLLPYYSAVTDALKVLKDTGDFAPAPKSLAPRDIFNVCGMKELFEFDKAAATKPESHNEAGPSHLSASMSGKRDK